MTDSVNETDVIHSVYLPFTVSQLSRHFAASPHSDKRIAKFLLSAKRYREFCDRYPSREGFRIDFTRAACQIEKDETFWTAARWLGLFYCETRDPILQLLKNCFGQQPPVSGLHSWEQCLEGDLELFLEAHLPAPAEYKNWLAQNLGTRHFIPYVIDAARRSNNRNFEGSTHVDALLVNCRNGFSVLVEAKVLSDLDCKVSFDCMRNQVARSIDAMLEPNTSLPSSLRFRNPTRSLFLLQTPEVFKVSPHSRLYGWLLESYRNDAAALARDLGHRRGIDFASLSKRIGWITWEDCKRVAPTICAWLPQVQPR